MFRCVLFVTFIILNNINYSFSTKLATYEKLTEESEIINCIVKVTNAMTFYSQQFNYLTLINVPDSVSKALQGTQHTFIRRSFNWNNDYIYNSAYLIMVVTYEELKAGLRLIKTLSFWNPKAYFIITIDDIDDLHLIPIALLYYHIYNVSVISNSENPVIYTLNTTLDSCNRFISKTLQPLSNCSNYKNEEIYNYKPAKRITNCHFKFVSHNYWPFIDLNDRRRIGSEDVILRTWKDNDNVTVELLDYGQVGEFGGVLENGSYYGMLRWIQKREVEGAIGGYVIDFTRSRSLDYTYPYNLDHQKVAICAPRQLSFWLAIIARFSNEFVLSFFLVFLLFVLFIKYSSKKKMCFSKSTLIVLGYFTNNIQKVKSNFKSGFRIALINLLICTIFFSNMFQAHLSSVKTEPEHEHQIDDLVFVTQTYDPRLESDWRISFDVDKFRYCPSKMECLAEVKNSNEKIYTVLTETEFDLYIWNITDDDVKMPVFRLRERVGTLLRSVILVKGSPAKEALDVVIQRLSSGGIIGQQMEDIIYREKLDALYRLNRKLDKFKCFTMIDMKQPFMFLLSGYCFSVITLICEIIYSRKKND